MRKYVVFVLAFVCILGLVGCTSKLDGATSSDNENELSGTTLYGLTAEVVEVLEDDQYEVKVTGEDQNFAKGDIVIINYYASDGFEDNSLKIGDIIAITY